MGRQFKPGQLQTGSLYNISASFALTASYVANPSAFPYSGSAVIIGSLLINSDRDDIFLIKNFAGNSLLTVSQSGVIVLATHSVQLTGSAPVGGIYFTSSSLFIGLE
jgi:hypothetical protein